MSQAVSPSVLDDALAFLTAAAAERAEPTEAQRRLHELRREHPGVQLRLVWQREPYDGSIHYDLLMTRPGSGTVSLSYAPDLALPWAFRGGHRVSERLLVRVNGVDMELDQAIACLDFLWDESRLADRLVTACLVREALEEDVLELSDAELQEAMDAFRRARGLLDGGATREWMARHCLSHADLEELAAGEAAVARLRKKTTGDRVRPYFATHRRQLDVLRIAELVFASGAAARRAADETDAGRDFFAMAEAALATGAASSPAGFFRTLRRGDLATVIAESVAGARAGMTLGPQPAGGGHALIRVLAVQPAVLDEPTTDLIERRLFDAWLNLRKESARVEWFWGNAGRTQAEDTTRAAARDDAHA
jgi:putative peptide maturation system protein